MESSEELRERLQKAWDARFGRDGQGADDELERHLQLRLAQTHKTPDERPKLSYRALAGPSCTRFLKLLPGTVGDEVCCELQEADLDDLDLDYVALSYTWGDDEHQLPIVCDGAVALVSVNLYSALLRLREADDETVLWADALCIDQGQDARALKERAAQVRMMDKIFTRASVVFVDLGGASEEGTAALFEGFTQFAEPNRRMFAPHRPATGVTLRAMNEQERNFWRLYCDFINRPWFKRVWVFQEFVLPKEVTFMLGYQWLDAYVMFHAVRNVRKHFAAVNTLTTIDSRPDWTFTQGASFQDLLRARYLYRLRGELPAVTCTLQSSVFRLATDPRDHVYAFLGLFPKGRFSNFAVDYTEDAESQALRFAACLVESNLGEYCLIRADGIHWRRPSWVPVLWQFELTTASNNLIDENSAETCFSRIYRACGPTTMSISLTPDKSIMAVKGVMIDTIESFSKPFIAVTHMQTMFRDGVRAQDPSLWYQDVYKWASRTFLHWDPEPFKEAFWRTLVLDAAREDSGGTKRSRASSTSGFEARFAALQRHLLLDDDDDDEETDFDPMTQDIQLYTHNFRGAVMDRCHLRKLCRTKGDRMALIPAKTVHDNEVWVFSGITVPFILRRLGEQHVLVGPCYVHGVMDGEALYGSDWREETIYLR